MQPVLFIVPVALAAYACGDGGNGGLEPDDTVASVTITPATPSIAPGGTVQLTATPRNAAGGALTGHAIEWSTANGPVVAVSATGLVTGVAEGQAIVTATSEGKVGQAMIEVEAAVAAVAVSPGRGTILNGATLQLAATAKDAGGATLTRTFQWSSSAPAVATVSATGFVTGVAPGAATISASAGGRQGSAAIAVRVLDVSGVWTFTETISDPALTLSCTDQATMTLTQTGPAFTGGAQQAGICMLGGTPFDNSGTFAMTDGLVQQSAIRFSEPGQPRCEYQGTLTADPPTGATGTVSCEGDVEGLGHVSATGAWRITR